MTKDLIYQVYNYNTHIDSFKKNAISTTTLIGAKYKAKKYLRKEPKDSSWVDNQYKRSSTLGTAFHDRAELVFKNNPNYECELYRERVIEVDGIEYVISGSCDLLERGEDGWTIADWKTHGFGEFKGLEQARKQLSIYRWLLMGEYTINDTGYVLSLSMSNNNKEKAHPIELMSLEQTEDFIEANLYSIVHNESVDCNDNVTFNMCTYCDYDCIHRQ